MKFCKKCLGVEYQADYCSNCLETTMVEKDYAFIIDGVILFFQSSQYENNNGFANVWMISEISKIFLKPHKTVSHKFHINNNEIKFDIPETIGTKKEDLDFLKNLIINNIEQVKECMEELEHI